VILSNYQLCYGHAIFCFGQLSVFVVDLAVQLCSVGLFTFFILVLMST